MKGKSKETDFSNLCGYCKTIGSQVLYPTGDIFGNQYTINRCNACGAYFLAPRPDRDRLLKAYDSSYYGESEEKFKASGVERVLDQFRLRRASRLARRLHDGDKVLDIGCGNGRFLASLMKYSNFRIYGTELPGRSAERAARVPGLTLKTGTLEPGDFPGGFFSAITLFHVFEHLEEPSEMLGTITHLLRPDGYLVISFPNIVSIQSRLFKGKWLHLDPPRHLFFFPPRDFTALMEGMGYRLLRKKYASTEQNPFGMVQSILNCILSKREVLFEKMKGNNAYTAGYNGFSLGLQRLFFLAAFPVFILTDLIVSLFGQGATVEFTFTRR